MTVQDTRSSLEEQEKMEKEQDLEEGECSDEEEELEQQQQVVVPAPPTHKTKGSGQPRNCTRISNNM